MRCKSLALLVVLLCATPPPPTASADDARTEASVTRLEALAREQASIVRTLLRSGEPRDVAWGAYTAGRSGLQRVGSDLIAALKRVRRDHRHARLAVLAALIDLEVAVDREVLVNCARARSSERAPAVILALQGYGASGLLAMWDAIEANDPYLPGEALIALGNRLAE